jgi:hypothetical protein
MDLCLFCHAGEEDCIDLAASTLMAREGKPALAGKYCLVKGWRNYKFTVDPAIDYAFCFAAG